MRGTERPGLGAVVAGVNGEAVAVSEPSPGLATRAACGAVRVYQRAFAGRLSPCRFWPTCSNYALDALLAHGFWRGSWLTTRRLARCHPWGGQGVDPVPERGGR
jgi:putative membrane protein insertion efficiency factor